MAHVPVFSARSLLRKPSPIRALQPLVGLPGMISLGGGYPNARTFPFEEMNIKVKGGQELPIRGQDLDEALQYSSTAGLPRLREALLDMVVNEHQPPLGREGTTLNVATGSQDAMTRAFEALLNPGDSLLVESPTYSGALAHLGPLQANLVGIPTDGEGLIPDELARVLDGWKPERQGPAPRVLYTIPNGSNPTGGSLTLERKRQLMDIARRHDLTVLEDDPYYYLQFAETRTPSLLSLDEDGRVVRFDSFSKILSSGLRVGFASGNAAVLEQMDLHAQSTALHTCGVAQAITLALLQAWGAEGFEKHLEGVVGFYRGQRDSLLASAEEHLSGLAEWSPPAAGMFLWMRLQGVDDTFDLITQRAVDAKVLFVPGVAFCPEGAASAHCRASFSVATPDQMDEAMQRLAALLK